MNINRSEPNLKDTVIPPDFLTKVHMGRCSYDFGGCSTPGALFSDLNIWSRALDEQEAIDWTSCKSSEKGDLVDWNTGLSTMLFAGMLYSIHLNPLSTMASSQHLSGGDDPGRDLQAPASGARPLSREAEHDHLHGRLQKDEGPSVRGQVGGRSERIG